MPQTSDRISALAARYVRYSLKELSDDSESDPSGLLRDIRSLAASALRQDEHKGLRGFIRKVVGK